jgi:nitrogen fixation NifU-like protein
MEESMFENLGKNYRKLPKTFGPLRGANGNAKITGPCGDTMEFWVYVENGKVCMATYTTDGCYHSIACGNAAVFLAAETNIEVANSIEQQDVLTFVGALPDESKHCALLAANTLKAAIKDYIDKNKRPAVCDHPEKSCSSCDKDNCEIRSDSKTFIEANKDSLLTERLGKIKNNIILYG